MLLNRKIHNVFHPIIGEIWCLHRVLPYRSKYKSNRDLEITPDYLEKIVLEKQRQGFRFVDLDTFVAAAQGIHRERELVHVTFDDGFADVFTYAYPILKQYNIPFTYYVTTDMPDGKADLWWLQLEQMVGGDSKRFEEIIKQVYSQSGHIATTMHTITDSGPDFTLCQNLCISWEQLQIMVSEGLCTIGSHGVSHSAMSLLPQEKASEELSGSKLRLKEMLGVEVQHFSYPHSLFTNAQNELVWKEGYRTIVVGYGGNSRREKNKQFFYRKFIVQP
jgi:peptidoglycan/xylan/chitin deacetylase (PgdA/CDA1 family)